MRTILINGYDRSGKSTFGDILVSKGYLLVELGEIVKNELTKKGIFKSEITKYYDINILSMNKLIMAYLDDVISNNSKIVICGCRSYALFKSILIRSNPNHIFFIEATKEIRFERGLKFDKYNRSFNIEKFNDNDLVQDKWGIENIKNESILIDNNTSFNKYIKTLDMLILKYNL